MTLRTMSMAGLSSTREWGECEECPFLSMTDLVCESAIAALSRRIMNFEAAVV